MLFTHHIFFVCFFAAAALSHHCGQRFVLHSIAPLLHHTRPPLRIYKSRCIQCCSVPLRVHIHVSHYTASTARFLPPFFFRPFSCTNQFQNLFRGTIQPKSTTSSSATITQEFTEADATELYNLAKVNGDYLLRVLVTEAHGSSTYAQTFVSACKYPIQAWNTFVPLPLASLSSPSSPLHLPSSPFILVRMRIIFLIGIAVLTRVLVRRRLKRCCTQSN